MMKHKAAHTLHSPLKTSIFEDVVALPAAIIKRSAIDNNIEWMQRFADQSSVCLAPHGKTTMTPALFKRQLKAGAWGITVATAYQAQIAAQAGARRIIIANQLLGQANMALVAELLAQGLDIYCCVDSVTNAETLATFFLQQQLELACLVEIGISDGRCGVRDQKQARQLAESIHALEGIQLAGVEFYEGVAKDKASVESWVQQAGAFCLQLHSDGLLQHHTALLTGAGSVWYDVVAESFARLALPDFITPVIRPGCYITHDHQLYHQAQQQIKHRSALAMQLDGDLIPALELVAFIQSIPEKGKAVLGLGKRDVAFDAGLPQVIALYRHGKKRNVDLQHCETTKVMDQHAFWHFSSTVQPQVGDMVVLGSSHPCLTFDKWRCIWLVDDDYHLLETIETFF